MEFRGMKMSEEINEENIGKYVVDKRNRTHGDVGQIVETKQYGKWTHYYLIKWIRVDKTKESSHKVDSYAMYTPDRLETEFIMVDTLDEVYTELI
jgi:hypothetical protein